MKRFHRLSRVGLVPFCVALACSEAEPEDLATDGPGAEGKADVPTGNGAVLSTGNGNVMLLSGYHSLYDKTHSQCVLADPQLATGTRFMVGDVQRKFEMVYVNSRAELARELGVDLGLKVKYPAVGVDVGFGLLDNFSSTTTSASFLMKISDEYFVRNRHPMQLTEAAQARLQGGADPFVRTCGTHYVEGVRYGGHLYVLVTFQSADEQTANEIKANLGVDVGYGPGTITGDLKARMASNASRSDVNVTVRVASRGFQTKAGTAANSAVVQDLLTGGINEQTFMIMDQLRLDMQESVARDICRDTGEGQCADGSAAPGYFDNVQRMAKPTGVEIGFYEVLPNADHGEGPDPFEVIITKLTGVERYVRDFAELQERMTEVYQNEVMPFVDASTSRKATFNVAPPAGAVFDPSVLTDLADVWVDEFYPLTGSQVGWGVQQASEAIKDCWNAASVSIEHDCGGEGEVAASETTLWKALLADLEEYSDTGRILPLRYVVGAAVASPEQARDVCAGLSLAGEPVRLPTKNEVEYLAPLAGYGPIAWDGTAPHEIWYRASSTYTGCDDTEDRQGFPHPLFTADPADDSPKFRCAMPQRVIQTICVPNSGPLPILSAP